MFNRIRRWFNRPQNPAGHVYYARFKFPQGTYYKIGFTSKTNLVERMAYSGCGDEKLIDREFFFSYREDAWDVEQTLLEHFGKYRAFKKFSNDPTMPLNGRGQTELFANDVLGLDEDLYRLTEQEKAAREEYLAQADDGCLMVLLGAIFVFFTLGFGLLFIAVGMLEMSSSEKSTLGVRRPQHPQNIQELLDELNEAGDHRKGAA